MNGPFFFAAAVFAGGRPERALRWLFVASFAVAVGSFVGLSLLGYAIVTFEGSHHDKLRRAGHLRRVAERRIQATVCCGS
jgi:hypothetical protein